MKKVSLEYKEKSKEIRTQKVELNVIDSSQSISLVPKKTFKTIPLSVLVENNKTIAKEVVYSFDGGLFKTIMQQIEITMKNINSIKGKNINFRYGIEINGEFEFVNMGTYHIKDVEDDKKNEDLKVTGYDKMLNFMKPFNVNDLKIAFPCRIYRLVQKMCEVCKVEPLSLDFYNADLLVDEDYFTAQELTYRDVLEKVAQSTLTTIFIKEDKLALVGIDTNNAIQELDTSYLSNLVIGEKFGPVNALVLGRGAVEDNIESTDDISINKNGRCEIRFDENEFLDLKRSDVIDDMLDHIKGMEYYAFEASDVGVTWLEPCDILIVKDREENNYKTIYLKASITFTTGIASSNMSADVPDSTTTEYKISTKEEKKHLKVERLAKKNEGLIQDVIEQTSEYGEKLVEHQQDIDSLKQSVYNMATYKREQEGFTELHLTEADNVNMLEFRVRANKTHVAALYPRNNLYPSSNIHPREGG